MPSAKKSAKSQPAEPTKSTTETLSEPTTSAPVVKQPKSVKSKKATETVDVTVQKSESKPKSSNKSDTAVVEPENVVVSAEQMTPSITENFSEFINKFQRMLTEFSALKNELRVLEKKTVKELRVVQKLNNKRKKKSGTRAPSGFVKPTKISDELATFLGKPFGSEMARTEVTREINSYIRLHNLQDKTNGRKINPDPLLAKLLKVTNEDELTYFNLQRYMSPHFAKGVPTVVASAPAPVAQTTN